jgi:hypothetical protein
VEGKFVLELLANEFFHTRDMVGRQIRAHLNDQPAVAEVKVEQVF